MDFPPLLHQGSKIAIIAPAGKIKPSSMEKAINSLTSWGLEVVIGEHVYDQDHYFSGRDAARFSDLQWAVDDDSIEAVLCARGGYGITRILPKIDFSYLRKNPKWIIGFSDITALLLRLEIMNLAGIHGPMGISFNDHAYEVSLNSLHSMLFKGSSSLVSNQGGISGTVTARITGGNLSLIMDSLGTNNEIETQGKILFIEEIGEDAYRVDRMFQQLLRAGKLENLAGLVVGHFTDIGTGKPVFGLTYQEIILDIVKQFSYPVGFGFGIGHEPDNFPIVIGGTYHLKVWDKGSSLQFQH